MSNASFSKLRDTVLQAMKPKSGVPLSLDSDKDKDAIEQITSLQLTGQLFTRTLGFKDRVFVNQRLSDLSDPKTGSLPQNLGMDINFISLLLSEGIGDSFGAPIFSVDDIAVLSGKYTDMIMSLCWQVLYNNDMILRAKQETVGNSDGTENSTNS